MRTLFARGLFVLLAVVAANGHAATGRTTGAFNVSADGAATYTIPLWTPPGPKNLQPSLALVYNSLGRNGTVGVGWFVAGLSSIERCNRTTGQDGFNSEVRVDLSDVYCLNGNRLRMTSGSRYGLPDSAYATEIADFSVTTANGPLLGGPTSFTVVTKSGLTMEYGHTADSRVTLTTGGNVFRWMLNRVRDREGNTYVVTYQTASGVAVPKTISWGPTAADASTYNYTAVFTYIDKASSKDWVTGFVAGREVVNKSRLENIIIQHAGSTIRKYVFTYDAGPITSLSRLRRIQECSDDAQSQCLSPTEITYQAGQAVVGLATVDVAASTTLMGAADFNGDGKDDLIYTNGSQWFVRYGANGGQGPVVTVTGLTGTTATVDYDRFLPNGRAAFIANIGGTLFTFSATDTNSDGVFEFSGAVPVGMTFPAGTLPTGIGGGGKASLAWFEREASSGTDRVHFRVNVTPPNGTSPVFVDGGRGNSLPLTTPDGGTVMHGQTRLIGGRGLDRMDVDGDGHEDFYASISVSYGASGRRFRALVRENGLELAPFQTWIDDSTNPLSTPIDFNDDRCTDLANGGSVQISKCDDTPAATVAMAGGLKWLDWDGDGRSDLLVNNGGNFGVHRSTGSGFMPLMATSIPSSGTYQVLDFDGDRLADLATISGGSIRYYTHASNPTVATLYATHIPDLVATITDGYGLTYTVDYVSTGQNNYSNGVESPVPLSAARPRIVVARARFPDGVGNSYTRTFHYVGAREDTARDTFAGFQERHEVDSRTSFTTRIEYKQLFPFTGWESKSEILQPDAKVIRRSTLTSAVHMLDATANRQRHFVYLAQSEEEQFEVGGALNGQKITTASTIFSDIDFSTGNTRTVIERTTDNDPNSPDFSKQWVTTTTNTFAPATSACLNMVTSTSITTTAPDDPNSVTRTVEYVPDPVQTCRAKQQSVEPGSAKYRIDTTFEYDDFGNVREARTVGLEPGTLDTDPYTPMTPRTTSMIWSPNGVFPVRVTDPLGQVTQMDYYFDRGLVRSTTDPNNLTTHWQYDEFGRMTRETRPDSTATTWAYSDCAVTGCYGSNHRTSVVQTEYDASGIVLTGQASYLDRFDRPLVMGVRAIDGRVQWNERQYDPLGRVAKLGLPCYAADPVSSCVSYWQEYAYDAIGRIKHASRPTNSQDLNPHVTHMAYAGRTTTVTDAHGNPTSIITDVAGRQRRTIDANNYAQTFNYSSGGELTSVVDSHNVTLFSALYEYGVDPFQIAFTDRALGTRTQIYNSLGELRRWSDAKGQKFSARYDLLGRLVERVEPDNTTTILFGTDASARNLNRMERVISTGGGTYSETFGYDLLGRLQRQSIAIPGEGSYVYEYGYDASTGELDTLTYPVSSTDGYRLRLKYNYQNGYLRSISDVANSGTVFWTMDSVNARGQVERDRLGSNIVRTRTYDAVTGFLGAIQAGPTGNTAALQNVSFLYDLVGNVTQRQNNRLGLTENFYYRNPPLDNLDRLREVRLTAGTLNATTLSLEYDAIGNIRKKTQPGGADATMDQTVAYTSYSYPASILAENGETASFSYGPDRQRWKMVFQSATASETTFYIGSLMEKVTTAGLTNYRHYIKVGLETIAIYARTSAGVGDVRYLLTDHLHSIDTIANASGVALANASFTPFGNRRDATDWSGPPANAERATMDGLTRQGFTFHTVLGAMGLNHMKGRVQDTLTGRFISPDPLVGNPTDTQSFNRYAYVLNNPLTFIDPDGFDGGTSWSLVIMYSGFGIGGEGWDPNVLDDFGYLSTYGSYSGYQWATNGVNTGDFDCASTFEACDRWWQQYQNDLKDRESATDGELDSRGAENTSAATGSVGQPGTAEGFIPIWGSGRSAVNDFQNGRWGWGSFNSAMAASDIFLVKAVGTMAVKGAWKAGSHTWGATRKWLARRGYAEKWQHVHHAIVPQRLTDGTWWQGITNQPWNLKPLEPRGNYTMNDWHRMIEGRGAGMNMVQRWWYGMPDWLRYTQISVAGDAVTAAQ